MCYSPAEKEIRLRAYFRSTAEDISLTKQVWIRKEPLEQCSDTISTCKYFNTLFVCLSIWWVYAPFVLFLLFFCNILVLFLLIFIFMFIFWLVILFFLCLFLTLLFIFVLFFLFLCYIFILSLYFFLDRLDWS